MAQPDCIIIDDDRRVLEVLEMYLENMGVFRNIIRAKDGSEASSKLSKQKFAVIILDINMPKKTGADIIKEMKQDIANNIPNGLDSIIIISGELDKAVLAGAMKAGVKHFLIKPFDEAAFVDKVRAVLEVTAPGSF